MGPDPGERAARGQDRMEPVGDRGDEIVAQVTSATVVDRSEVVELEEQDPEVARVEGQA